MKLIVCCFQTHPPAVSGRILPSFQKLRFWNPGFTGFGLAHLYILNLNKEYWCFHSMNLFVGRARSPEEHLHSIELCLESGIQPHPYHLIPWHWS